MKVTVNNAMLKKPTAQIARFVFADTQTNAKKN